ncbi:MAG: MFS transporter [Oscillospiraceae bacterium]|nr:MFS transporter [Oscillospiraceae bacterium]
MEKLLTKVGYGGLGKNFYRFFFTHTGVQIFTSLQPTFMNVLLMRVTGGSDTAMKFNIISTLISGFTLAASVPLAKRTSSVYPLRLGIVMYLAMYLTFFVMFDHVGAAMPLLAVFSGLGSGFYWYAYNIGAGGYLDNENRDKGIGLLSIGHGFSSLAVPFIAGLIISSFDGLAGYLVVFAMGFAVSVMTVIVSVGLEKLPQGDRRTHYGTALKITFTDRGMHAWFWSTLVRGIRLGTLQFFLNLLVYEVAASEFVVGFSGLLSGIMAILGATVYGRIVTKKNRFRSMTVATTVLAAGALALLLDGSAPVILFAMLNSFFGGFLNNPAGSIFYAAIELPAHAPYQGELNGIREAILSIGMAAGIAFTMHFADLLSPAVAILILTVSQYLMILLHVPIQKVLDSRQD